jgi:hypothetical protein
MESGSLAMPGAEASRPSRRTSRELREIQDGILRDLDQGKERSLVVHELRGRGLDQATVDGMLAHVDFLRARQREQAPDADTKLEAAIARMAKGTLLFLAGAGLIAYATHYGVGYWSFYLVVGGAALYGLGTLVSGFREWLKLKSSKPAQASRAAF